MFQMETVLINYLMPGAGFTAKCSHLVQQPNPGQGRLTLEVSRTHKVTQLSRYDSSGRVIGRSQRLLPHNGQHLQQTRHPSPGGVRTSNSNKRAVEDRRLRVKTHTQRRGAERPAACDLIRGNKSTALFPRIKSQAAGRPAPPRSATLYVCFYP